MSVVMFCLPGYWELPLPEAWLGMPISWLSVFHIFWIADREKKKVHQLVTIYILYGQNSADH